jgi:threonine aldolase
MELVDLRSDTVTVPDEGMRRAMAQAEVGDDVFGEDPTVNRLQERAAELLGKEAALYVPSGTMANQVSLRILTRPGDEVICDQWAHLFRFEGGAAAVLSSLSFFPLPGERGLLSPEQVATAIQGDNIHFPVSRVVTLENTHNRGCGAVYPMETIRAVAKTARDHDLKLHLDGARMFHACTAGGYSPVELASVFDTVSFCLSKGLGAPVGSMVVSSQELIKEAVRVRKRLGGGMRQAGILAAAGLYALEHNLDRLEEDHRRAKRLALGLAEMGGLSLNPDEVETNIVIFDVTPSGMDSAQALDRLQKEGVRVVPFGGNNLRAVTHLQISDKDIDIALSAFNRVFA